LLADGGDYDEGIMMRGVEVLLTLSGMLFFALLLGLITDTIESKLDELKQGKNRIVEEGHTLILGWNDKIEQLVLELALANESEGGGVVVILSEMDKELMDGFFRCTLLQMLALIVLLQMLALIVLLLILLLVYSPPLYTRLLFILASSLYSPPLYTRLLLILASSSYSPPLYTCLLFILASSSYSPPLPTSDNVEDVDLRGTQVVCRSGNPVLTTELRKVSAHAAKSVVVLMEGTNALISDARAIRCALALIAGVVIVCVHHEVCT
jgi:hypothetical protein